MADKKSMTMVATGASIVVVRDGKRMPVPLNVPFDFTEDEVIAVRRSHPRALRQAVNELAPSADADDDETETEAKKPAKSSGKKAAAKKPAAKKADADEDEDI